MAQQQFRVRLQSADFPLLSEDFGRTVITPVKGEQGENYTSPQVYYCHNVLPTKEGFEAVSYKEIIPLISEATVLLDEVLLIRGNNYTPIHLAWNTNGELFALKEGAASWLALPLTFPRTIHPNFDVHSVTIGTVNGISYIYYRNKACFIYDEATDSLQEVTLNGLDLADIKGIASSSGYLLAYTEQAIAWSSTIDPTDFVPSTITGAGGGNIAGLAGSISFVFANDLGFLAYSTGNIIAATYTGNSKFPFKFREVADSKGVTTHDSITYGINSTSQFMFSKAGLQAVSSQRATPILPEVTDFLRGEVFEDFDETTLKFTRTELSSHLLYKIKFVNARFLVISYGVTSLTHALVYDTVLNRLGKLKVPHRYVFEYAFAGPQIAKEAIAFMDANGRIQAVDSSPVADSVGVLIAGKFQGIRSRNVTLQEVSVENIKETSSVEVYDLYSYDGKNLQTAEGYAAYSAPNIRKFNFHSSGVEHSILLKGAFKLVSMLLTYTYGGRR